ncbi:PP2C family protein-serine/threonine phosphatase [Streptomyces morookaense]|uniref:PP2C family protein-serine/threonine phosphatase n=1 Tax=Streptomyces morookaense TaxID=1970 RepID=UPI0033D6DFA6
MIRTRALLRCRRIFVLILPGLWVSGVLAWECVNPLGTEFMQLLAAAPAIACAGTGRRRCVLLGGLCALLALLPVGPVARTGAAARLGTCCAILAVVAASYLTSGRRLRLLGELERIREVAATAQLAVLRPLPPRIEGITLAGVHLSASEGALIGGDLYEVLATPHGVRLVMGDVRGHGIPAIATVAALLGSFRDAAHDEAELPDVLRRLERALQRHLGEKARTGPPGRPEPEDFATVLLLEVREEGHVAALNCGHPWPHHLTRAADGTSRVVALEPGEPLPPLGLFPLPAELPLVPLPPLAPGEALVLHTDGAEDARDRAGRLFPLAGALADAVRSAPPAPAAIVERVRAALLRHTRGLLSDDFALLAIGNDRPLLPGPLALPCGRS